jgi:hypothetical protein
MKPFAENKYMLFIAFTLAIGHAIPLYMSSFFGDGSQHPINIFGLGQSPLASLIGIAGISDAIAIVIALTAENKAPGLLLGKWTAKLTLTASLLYFLLLIGSLTIDNGAESTWSGFFALLTAPFTAIWFLIIAIVTGLIIRPSTPKP